MFCFLIIIFLFYQNLFSYISIPYNHTGSYAGLPMEFLSSFTLNARSAGLGNAYTGCSGDISCVYWNPAGISRNYFNEISLISVPLFSDTQYTGVSFGFPFSNKQIFGITLIRLISGAAERTNSLGENLGYTFRDTYSAYLLSYAINYSSHTGFGLNFKYINQTMDDYYEKTYNFDLGLIINSQNNNIGFSIQNVLPFTFGREKINPDIRFGIVHTDKKIKIFTDFYLLDVFDWNVFRWSTGIEYNIFNNFSIRTGLNHREITAGFGIFTQKLSFDYGVSFNKIDILHKFSINFRYGYLIDYRVKLLEEEIEKFDAEKKQFLKTTEQTLKEIKEQQEKLKIMSFIDTQLTFARQNFEAKKYDESKKILKQIINIQPDNSDANLLLKEIEKITSQENISKKYFEALTYYNQQKYDIALDILNSIVSAVTDNKEYNILLYLTKAQIYLRDKKFSEAKDVLIEIIKIEPNHELATTLLKRIQNIIDLNK